MKKVILFAAVAAMVSLASCKKGGEATAIDSVAYNDSVAAAQATADSLAALATDSAFVDSALVAAQ